MSEERIASPSFFFVCFVPFVVEKKLNKKAVTSTPQPETTGKI
jgi:hypothetical protein